jgi:hypothetical protein
MTLWTGLIWLRIGHQQIQTIKTTFPLYGCETWSVTQRKDHRLRVFENRVLRRIFGPMMDEVTGEWRRLHNEELCTRHQILCG